MNGVHPAPSRNRSMLSRARSSGVVGMERRIIGCLQSVEQNLLQWSGGLVCRVFKGPIGARLSKAGEQSRQRKVESDGNQFQVDQ